MPSTTCSMARRKSMPLTGIDVNGMDFRRAIEQVVEGIATGARDHDDTAVGTQLKQLAVDPRILPARVVNKLSAMDVVKYEIMRRLEKTASGSHAGVDSHQMTAIHLKRDGSR